MKRIRFESAITIFRNTFFTIFIFTNFKKFCQLTLFTEIDNETRLKSVFWVTFSNAATGLDETRVIISGINWTLPHCEKYFLLQL